MIKSKSSAIESKSTISSAIVGSALAILLWKYKATDGVFYILAAPFFLCDKFNVPESLHFVFVVLYFVMEFGSIGFVLSRRLNKYAMLAIVVTILVIHYALAYIEIRHIFTGLSGLKNIPISIKN